MKILLFGSNGMLGGYIKSYLGKKYYLIPLTRKDLDIGITSEESILDKIRSLVDKNDVIINSAGIIKQRNYNSIELIKVNSIFPHLLAKIKEEIGCKVIHITTDCVFDGKVGSYQETSFHNCLDEYGKSKSLGENPKVTNIRTSIIGEEKDNKLSLVEWLKSNSGLQINGYTNHIWNGVTCLELCRVIEDVIEKGKYWDGTRHIFSPREISKFELVSIINEIYELNIKILPAESQEQIKRNLISTQNYPLEISDIREQIKRMKEYDND